MNMAAPRPSEEASTPAGLFEFTPDTLRERLEAWSQPSYRVEQILQWAYERNATSYDEMSNLPLGLRSSLSGETPLFTSTILSKQVSSDGTVKMLLGWPDGNSTECVLIPDERRMTACISTQVGCPVACLFCASGLDGLTRNLTAGQIVEQAVRVRQLCPEAQRLSNVVFMGLGEPLANYDATVHALRTLNAPWGMGIGARKMTVSTVGLPLQMRRLADEHLPVTLALSLHAPTDDLRAELIPWAKRTKIAALIEACSYYFEKTGREVTFEYILLGGVNDSPKLARDLAHVARRCRSNINLIPYNPVAGLPYRRPDDDAVDRFLSVLSSLGVNTHVRRNRGRDIDSACGQLRRRVHNLDDREKVRGSCDDPEQKA